jgi:hypothetical protein
MRYPILRQHAFSIHKALSIAITVECRGVVILTSCLLFVIVKSIVERLTAPLAVSASLPQSGHVCAADCSHLAHLKVAPPNEIFNTAAMFTKVHKKLFLLYPWSTDTPNDVVYPLVATIWYVW